MSALGAVQQAVYSALTGNATLMSLINGVYDDTPEAANFPYVSIGDSSSIMFDTKSADGLELLIDLHTWSRYRGRKQTKDIQGAIYDVLHNNSLAVSGYNTVFCYTEFQQDFLDEDGLTRHGVSRFKIVITEV